MSGLITVHKPTARLRDPADYQRPITFYSDVIIRHWRKILIFSAALTGVIIFVCGVMPPVHVGSALISVDRQSVPETVGSDRLMTTGDDQFMATQQSLLTADSILRPVEMRFHLLEREHQLRHYYFFHYPKAREIAIRNAPIKLKHLTIERSPNTYLLTINYRDKNPLVAAAVANAIADSYLAYIFDTRTREAGRLMSSMEKQLVDLKQKMESTHAALMIYQRELGTADPEQKTSVLVARLQALNAESSAAESDRITKESVFRAAKDGTLPEVQVSSQAVDLSKDVQNLQTAKANLALIAATYGDHHPEYLKAAAQVKQASDALDESRKNVLSRIGVDFHQTQARERMLAGAVAETKQQVDDLTAESFDYLQLKHEADAAEHVYEDLFAKIKQSGINSELQNNIIRLADSARPPAKPVFPNWPVIIACAMAMSLLAGCIYFICVEMTDETAHEADAIEEALGVPVVGSLPQVMDMQLRLAIGQEGVRFAGNRWRSIQCGFFDEGIRHLRGYLMLSTQPHPPHSVLVTSSLPSEGKSTLALSLAMANAERGKRTLIIDGDLRQPSIERLVRLQPNAGLAGVLAQSIHWKAATRAVPKRANLFVLGSGAPIPMALALIGPQMRSILSQATKEFDLVVVDSPPLLGCAETLELAAAAEATVVAVRSGHTPMKLLASTVETLRRVNVPIAGIVLNESSNATDATREAYARYYSELGRA